MSLFLWCSACRMSLHWEFPGELFPRLELCVFFAQAHVHTYLMLTQGTELGILSTLGCSLQGKTYIWMLLVFSTLHGTRAFPSLYTFLVSEVVPEFLPFLLHLWDRAVRTEHSPPGESVCLIYRIALWSLVCYSWSYSWWILMPW